MSFSIQQLACTRQLAADWLLLESLDFKRTLVRENVKKCLVFSDPGLGLRKTTSYLRAASVERPLRVEVGDGSAGNVHTDQRPVDLQVDGDQQQVLLKDVHLTQGHQGGGHRLLPPHHVHVHLHFVPQHTYVFRPALDAFVTFRPQFIVEETVEEVNLPKRRVTAVDGG